MNKILLTALTLVMMISAALPALAFGPLDVDADLTYMSKYVWRGMVANPEAVLQPSMSASIMGIGFGFWGNMDLTDITGRSGEFTEIDYVATYGLPLPFVDLDFGLIYYDFKEVDGAYVSAGISHGVAMGPELELELGATVGFGDTGYGEHYYGLDSGSLTDFLISASVPFDPIPFFTITPSVNYGTQMGDAKTSTDDADGDSDAFFYGISASFSF